MLIPVEFFVPIDSESHDQAAAMETSSYLDESKHIILLEEQTSDSWINVSKLDIDISILLIY